MPALTDERRAMVRRLYEESPFSVEEILVFACISRPTLYKWAKREEWERNRHPGVGWRPRKEPPSALSALAGVDRTGEDVGDPDIGREEVARRLWAALDLHLKELETAEPPAGMVRQGQNLATLARTLGMLVDVERDIAADKGKAGDDDGEARDRDGLLQEIMRRVETME